MLCERQTDREPGRNILDAALAAAALLTVGTGGARAFQSLAP